MKSEPIKLLKPAEIMALLGVNERTIYNYRKQGMPFEQWTSRTYRYDRDAVLEWVRGRRENGQGVGVLGKVEH